jgi:ribosomal protein S20
MATSKKQILERQVRDIEGAKNFEQLKNIVKNAVKEISADHKKIRDDIVAIEKRLDDGGL